MIEDRLELPAAHGRDPNDQAPRKIEQPEPRCESHKHGICRCEDDGSGAPEAAPEDDIR